MVATVPTAGEEMVDAGQRSLADALASEFAERLVGTYIIDLPVNHREQATQRAPSTLVGSDQENISDGLCSPHRFRDYDPCSDKPNCSRSSVVKSRHTQHWLA